MVGRLMWLAIQHAYFSRDGWPFFSSDYIIQHDRVIDVTQQLKGFVKCEQFIDSHSKRKYINLQIDQKCISQ